MSKKHVAVGDIDCGSSELFLIAGPCVIEEEAMMLRTAERLKGIAGELGVPLIRGRMPNPEREQLYQAFREGSQKVLLVSKVGNFAIDLPDANVAIQVSGTFGSRQEEAQRLGRILRPKADGGGATFYSLVSEASVDQDYAEKRQRFLTEQGYAYTILTADSLRDGEAARG